MGCMCEKIGGVCCAYEGGDNIAMRQPLHNSLHEDVPITRYVCDITQQTRLYSTVQCNMRIRKHTRTNKQNTTS